MNLSCEETGRNKTSGVILPARWEWKPSPPTWIFYGLQLPDAGQESESTGKKWMKKKQPCVWHLLLNIHSWGQHLDLDSRSICQYGKTKKVPLNVKTNKWSIYRNKLGLSFSSLTGYQFPWCSWHCCHGDFLYQAVCFVLKLLQWRKAIIPSSPVKMAWCAMMWSSFFHPALYGLT